MVDGLRFCSNCKKDVSRANYTVHTVHCQRNILVCTLCQESVLRSQYQHHVESAHSAVPCELCGEKMEALKIYTHQKEECPKRLLVCRFCEIEVIASEMGAHLEYCGARTDRCKGCSKYVQSKHLQFHYENDHKYVSPTEKEEADAEGSEGEDTEECPICLGPVTLPLALECGHIFCMVCVKGIANTTKNCAICRRDIQRDMLMDIRFCREEDIIKNYVNKPKYRKTTRSLSVPSKSSRRVQKTTQEYDDMVSTLLSNRTSSANCRYQRPHNGHTPSPYTPYCYATSCTASATTSSSCSSALSTTTHSSGKNEQDAVRCSTQASETEMKPRVRSSNADESICSSSSSSSDRVRPSPTPSKIARPSNSIFTAEEGASVVGTSVSPPSGVKPRRPTTLALKKEDQNLEQRGYRRDRENAERDDEQPALSQIEYDRWLAFQLARDEDDLPASEFNQRHKVPMRRSQSMPERKEDSESVVKDIDGDKVRERLSNQLKIDAQSRLPPASPRCSSVTPGGSGNSGTNASNIQGTNLTKSSSDSIATGTISTGARPKSSTGLKKRVSFKEDGPPVPRQAPVMLPCEFCEEMFSERDLMRHQTSCDQNETKNPREFLESRRSSVSSTPNSPSSSLPAIPSPIVSSKPPSLPVSRSSESPSKIASNKSLRTPPQSPSPRPRQAVISPVPLPRSSSITQLNDSDNSQTNSRHTSLSPGPGASMSSSSGIGSATSSFSSSSVSTTPSNSSSASPVLTPAAIDTPTDNEGDLEEEDVPLPRPRKGRLLSSAITSWRSISGSSRKERPKYTRSNTAPLEPTDDAGAPSDSVITSLSASQLPPIVPPSDKHGDTAQNKEEADNSNQQTFVKTRNKYPAPPPPPPPQPSSQPSKPPVHKESTQKSTFCNRESTKVNCGSIQNKIENEKKDIIKSDKSKEAIFRFDSQPLMKGEPVDVIPCEFCEKVFTPEKFRSHQTMCENVFERNRRECAFDNHEISGKSCSSEKSNDGTSPKIESKEITPITRRHNKGPAPKPPSKPDKIRSVIGRSNSVRERSTGCARNYEFEAPIRRLERASSIKETERSYRETSPISNRWSWSREALYGRGGIDSSKAYSGDNSLNSSTTSLNNYSSLSQGRSSTYGMRDESYFRRSVTSLALTSPSSSVFLSGARSRERSLSRHRLYGSRGSFSFMTDTYMFPSDKRHYLR